jgi:hypothetical protein
MKIVSRFEEEIKQGTGEIPTPPVTRSLAIKLKIQLEGFLILTVKVESIVLIKTVDSTERRHF